MNGHGVSRRRIPYPYRAIIAVCSDLDETPDLALYLETLRFLNTSDTTRFGPGLGLEVGNTIYFDMPAAQFSYWNTDDRGREVVRELIRSGHVDCLHSFGDLATTRAHAGRALDDLDRHGCRLQVWIDHAVAPSNFGADIMKGAGDVPGSPVYHADLTHGFGIRYVWRGRVTSVIGQGVRRRLGGIGNAAHPLASLRTLGKEAAKGIVGRTGAAKYAVHARNAVVEPSVLRDGRPVNEFLRSNPHWGGVSCGETAAGIGQVLVEPMLRRLVEREAACILYTHLGKTVNPARPFDDAGVAGWRHLAHAYHSGRILVTTTRRLLGYWTAVDSLSWSVRTADNVTVIDVTPGSGCQTRSDLEGLTFYVRDASRTAVAIEGTEVEGLRRNPPDHTGRPSVSVPRRRLEFPAA